jgi:hypothetical protein
VAIAEAAKGFADLEPLPDNAPLLLLLMVVAAALNSRLIDSSQI